jgi:hypothetical protein
MKLNKFLSEMQKVITASQQGNLFGDTATLSKDATNLCITYLRSRGYSIGEPVDYPIKISKLDDLIVVFYSYVRGSYEDHLWPTPNMPKDRAIAKKFVENRMKADGLDKEHAMQQCGYIIQTIFKNSDIFKFESPPTFGILGQGELAWITDRALQILNKVASKNMVAAQEKFIEDITEKIEKNYSDMGYSNEELEDMLKNLEEQYGKKES